METRIVRILDNISDGFIALDENWNFIYTNGQAERILQHKRDGLMGRNIWEVFPSLVGTDLYKDHLEVIEDGVPRTSIHYCPSLDCWLEVRTYPDENGIIVYFRDITHEKKGYEEHQQSIMKLQAIFESSAVGLGILGFDGKPIEYNQALLDMIGYSCEEIRRMTHVDFTHPQDIHLSSELMKKLRQKKIKNYKIEKRLIRKDGEIIWARISTSLLCDAEGNPQSYISAFENITELKAIEEKQLEIAREWERLSSYDGLTEVNNRRAFDQFLKKEWKHCLREGKPISLILADVDCFKSYNDTYGHLEGDGCLKRVAHTLKNTLANDDFPVYRYGGEEFAMILPGVGEKRAHEIAEMLRKNIEGLKIQHDSSKTGKHVTLSFGVATIIPNAVTFKQLLIKKADTALYEAKCRGRNRVVLLSS